MQILILAPKLPWPAHDGGSIRLIHTLRHLAGRHAVTLATTVGCKRDLAIKSSLEEFCEKVVVVHQGARTADVCLRLVRGLLHGLPLICGFYYSAELAAQIASLTAETHYDLVQFEFPFMAAYLMALSRRHAPKRILSMHNVESVRFDRELQMPGWGSRQWLLAANRVFSPQWEESALSRFDGILTVSELDRTWVQARAPGAIVEVAPNGVDASYFLRSQTCAREPRPYVVFTGAMDYPPNIDAALWFCKEILPVIRRRVPELGVKIVGKNPGEKLLALDGCEGVTLTGTVADVRSFLEGALCMVVPLRSGGGTRLKILEAMAMSCPVVSTTIGAEGLHVSPSVNIWIADTPQEFCECIDRVAKSPDLRNAVGEAGRRLVVADYQWKDCLKGLDRLYDRLNAE